MNRLLYLFSGVFLFPIHIQSQSFQYKHDTVTVLDGKAKLLVPEGDLKIEKKKALLKEYEEKYGMNNLHCVSGFASGGISYRFYHTNLHNPNLNDYGVNTWKLISLFTDKVPESDWLKSGLEMLGPTPIYYVDLISMKKDEEKFLRFFFFNQQENLVFISFECPLSLRKENNFPDINQLMITYQKELR